DVGRLGDRRVFNIIDYKTSAKSAVKEAEIHSGRQIQLPLYALAVERLLLAGERAAALSAGYWSIRGHGFGSKGGGGVLAINAARDGALSPAAGWSHTEQRLVERIGEMIAGIRRGWFPVFNDDANCTSFCNYRTICRVGHIRSLEKQWPAPQVPVEGAEPSPATARGGQPR
ncbi:MAG TPA: PD-(D/E)XK nuclease family protein, partial [Lacipirellulaceae bacterium]|nr:PD-(D/E)XK nuclease family protein [Lacipirellulaceae bacterium]